MTKHGRIIPIVNLEATCPFCGIVNTFEEYDRNEDHYLFITGQIHISNSCEHFVNHYKDGSKKARFYKGGKELYLGCD